jgi:hypothetical protein
VVNGVRRPGCNGTYVCLGCERECGWCFGCGDDMPELCDDCWFDVTKAREAASLCTVASVSKGVVRLEEDDHLRYDERNGREIEPVISGFDSEIVKLEE